MLVRVSSCSPSSLNKYIKSISNNIFRLLLLLLTYSSVFCCVRQKVVLRVDFHCEKMKTKAMKAVSKLPGVESVSVDIKDKKLTITGDVDPVCIVDKLKKGYNTEIISVGPAKQPKEDKEKKKKEEEAQRLAELRRLSELCQCQMRYPYPCYCRYQYPCYCRYQYPCYCTRKVECYCTSLVEEDPTSCVIC